MPKNFHELNAKVISLENNSAELCQVKIGILRNFTINQIDPYLKFHLYQNKLWPSIVHGEIDNIHQDVINPSSKFNKYSYDVIVLSLFFKELLKDYEITDWEVKDTFDRLEDMYLLLETQYSCHIIINTFVIPSLSEFGILEVNAKESITKKILELNSKIHAFVRKHDRFSLIDVENLIYRIGYKNSIDLKMWYAFKAPFKTSFLDIYAKDLFKIISAYKVGPKKCIVVDCDNTLWGGVVGEEGFDGIMLDKHEGVGKAYYDFQKTLLHLYDRGVIIALCSKNNSEDVWNVIDNHESCLLKRDHIVTTRINWSDKISNIISIADELNIGLDSLLFLDDDPVECELVLEMIPEVTVLQVPKNIYNYPNFLLDSGFFDSISITAEDRGRVELYKTQAKRDKEFLKYSNIDDFLATLDMKVEIREAGLLDVARVSQLTLKTNQFNLTTKRYNENDIHEYINNENWSIYILEAEDKYGEYGKVGVIIFEKMKLWIRLDTFLLSCRILSRNLENVFFSQTINKIRDKWDVQLFSAHYIPTHQNIQTMNVMERFLFDVQEIGKSKDKIYQQTYENIKLFEYDYIDVK